MHVRLFQTSARYLHEPRFGLELLNCCAPQVAHPCSQTAYKLVHYICQRATVRNPAYNTLWHQLLFYFDIILLATILLNEYARKDLKVNALTPTLLEKDNSRAG